MALERVPQQQRRQLHAVVTAERTLLERQLGLPS
jgi:hypothetical protein